MNAELVDDLRVRATNVALQLAFRPFCPGVLPFAADTFPGYDYASTDGILESHRTYFRRIIGFVRFVIGGSDPTYNFAMLVARATATQAYGMLAELLITARMALDALDALDAVSNADIRNIDRVEPVADAQETFLRRNDRHALIDRLLARRHGLENVLPDAADITVESLAARLETIGLRKIESYAERTRVNVAAIAAVVIERECGRRIPTPYALLAATFVHEHYAVMPESYIPRLILYIELWLTSRHDTPGFRYASGVVNFDVAAVQYAALAPTYANVLTRALQGMLIDDIIGVVRGVVVTVFAAYAKGHSTRDARDSIRRMLRAALRDDNEDSEGVSRAAAFTRIDPVLLMRTIGAMLHVQIDEGGRSRADMNRLMARLADDAQCSLALERDEADDAIVRMAHSQLADYKVESAAAAAAADFEAFGLKTLRIMLALRRVGVTPPSVIDALVAATVALVSSDSRDVQNAACGVAISGVQTAIDVLTQLINGGFVHDDAAIAAAAEIARDEDLVAALERAHAAAAAEGVFDSDDLARQRRDVLAALDDANPANPNFATRRPAMRAARTVHNSSVAERRIREYGDIYVHLRRRVQFWETAARL
jgi:hypothetical protein